uniref:GDSL esterase/lipase n=1 Tax=Oryza glumipatula TaxID=40148 RepID=A0A0E0AQ36_9ORYZ
MATLRPAPASMVVLCAVVVVGAVLVVAAEGGGIAPAAEGGGIAPAAEGGGIAPAAEGGGSEEAAASTGKAAMVPALFVFGDSLIDNGNNNNLASCLGCHWCHPSGHVQQLLQGVNFASAAAGILDESGGNFVGRIPFNQQIDNFEATVEQIAGAVGGKEAAASMVARSILFVGLGSNDYLNNYLMPNYNTRRRYTPRQFADLLADRYAAQLTRLYKAGARKFVVAGVGSMGCIPNVLAQSVESRCSPEVDALVVPFNANVRAMLGRLDGGGLPGASLVFLDNYGVFKAILGDPAAHGFAVVDRGCCGIGRNAGQVTCLPFMPPCDGRDRYVFWDAFHPTAAVNVLIAREAFYGGADVVSPINVRRLAAL